MAGSYDKGDVVRLSATFKNSAGTPIDPTDVFAKYQKPDGIETSLKYGVDPALVKDSVGNWHVDVSLDAAGNWYYRFESTGSGQAAAEGSLHVKASVFA